MNSLTKGRLPWVLGILILLSPLLVPAEPALARTHFFFGLNVGIPLGPYPAYAYPYPAPVYVYYPPPGYYPPAPYHRVYPPCVRVWTPGYYEPYGNWVFGYYRYQC